MYTRSRSAAQRWRAVFATEDGSLHEDESFFALGSSGLDSVALGAMIPLPDGTTSALLPGCGPVVADSSGRQMVHPDPEARPVAALLPTGYTRLLTPAYEKVSGAPHMPIFGYTAVAGLNGRLFASAVALDPGGAWDPAIHNTPELADLVSARLAADPENRLLRHHAHCATEYGCYTAQNLFYGRAEMAIAVSVACNAQCVGCISEQLEDDLEAPHDRIQFTPTADEVVKAALPHLLSAADPIVSFGQGCEGEPILRTRLIGRAMRALREQTSRGQFHINTNGSNPRALRHLIDCGLDSIRVSIFSAIEGNHVRYYGPRNYGLAEMEESLRMAADAGLHTSVNLLAYPGFIDTPLEMEAMVGFLHRGRVQMVQMRALNMDRELLEEKVRFPRESGIGIARFMAMLREELPGIVLASKTPYVGRARAHVS